MSGSIAGEHRSDVPRTIRFKLVIPEQLLIVAPFPLNATYNEMMVIILRTLVRAEAMGGEKGGKCQDIKKERIDRS